MLSVKGVALVVGRHPQTIRVWIRHGQLPAKQDHMSGRWWVSEADLRAFCDQRNVPVIGEIGPSAEEA